MIIVLKRTTTKEEVDCIVKRIKELGLDTHFDTGKERTIIGVIGRDASSYMETFIPMPGVERVVPLMRPYKLASRELHSQDTVIEVMGQKLGGDEVKVIAGPCSVESREMMLEVAKAVKAAGASFLRGGAFKPRSSPYSFQGLGEEALEYLAEAREITGLPVITEAMDVRQAEVVAHYADVIQIGARNMQNFMLLKEVGGIDKPVMLKRGMSATVTELLMSAEYIMSEGNHQVILCERGIRTFETETRNTLDLSAVPVIKQLSHLPVIVDPSHGGGRWDLVSPLSKAAIAVGADGVMVEVHPNPMEALSDGAQSLKPAKFELLMKELEQIAAAVGRK